jgi:hypothetical protein
VSGMTQQDERAEAKVLKQVRTETEAVLLAALRMYYKHSEYIFLDHFRYGMDQHARIADAIAIGKWKSRDPSIEGFEVKISRNDWLQELEKPEKAEEIAQFCDHWWVIVPQESVIKTEELPRTWGLYVLRGGIATVQVQAPKLTPKDPTRLFISCLMRDLQFKGSQVGKDEAQIAREQGYGEGFAEGREKAKNEQAYALEAVLRRNAELYDTVEALRRDLAKATAAGSIYDLKQLDTNDLREIGQLVRFLRGAGGLHWAQKHIGKALSALRTTVKDFEAENTRVEQLIDRMNPPTSEDHSERDQR